MAHKVVVLAESGAILGKVMALAEEDFRRTAQEADIHDDLRDALRRLADLRRDLEGNGRLKRMVQEADNALARSDAYERN